MSSKENSGNLIILNSISGALQEIRNVTKRKFIGNLDDYFVNGVTSEFLETFDFESLNEIPYEFIYDPSRASEMFSPTDISEWNDILRDSPISPKNLMTLVLGLASRVTRMTAINKITGNFQRRKSKCFQILKS